MSRPRSFDYDEASARYTAGEPVTALALEYGVSVTAIYWAVNPELRARSAAYAMSAACVDCGARCAKYRTGQTGPSPDPRCMACAAKHRTTSAREGELRCGNCREWKPDAAFPMGHTRQHGRRGRNRICRACHTILRRDYRNRHKVPCVRCGQPRLAPNETGAQRRGLADTGLCRGCYLASRKAAA